MEKKGNVRVNKTQNVLDHLKERGSITSWEAIDLFGATRLSAIIYNLRKNHNIQSVDVTDTDRYGNTSTFSKYIYLGEVS